MHHNAKSKSRLLQTIIFNSKRKATNEHPCKKESCWANRRLRHQDPFCILWWPGWPRAGHLMYLPLFSSSVHWDCFYALNLLKNTPFPVGTGSLLSESQYDYFPLYHHQISINSSYLVFCCLSFLGHRLWYLNYCLDWQEAIISTESDHFHRSTNKNLAFWQTSCPINPSHSQITKSM